MKTVNLRIDVPEAMTNQAIVDMLDDMTADLSCMDTGVEDEIARASDADWMDDEGTNYWNP